MSITALIARMSPAGSDGGIRGSSDESLHDPAMMPHYRTDPAKMTGRAQLYLTVGGLRHLATGAFMIFAAHRFTSASFIPIINTAPLWVWGTLSILTGSLMSFAAVARTETPARWGLIGSSIVTGMIGVGLTLAALQNSVAGVVGAFVYLSVTAKDLIQCLDPLRSPFESLFRRKEKTARAEARL